MATERQREANRRNSQRSSGPRTPEGKAVVSRNALKHGLLSQRVVLEDEDQAMFERFRDGLLAALAPEGELEQLLAGRIVASSWRLGRAEQIEQAMLAGDVARYDGSMSQALDNAHAGRARGPAADDRLLSLGWAVADAFDRSDRYGKLSRYEAHIERGLYRALHELQRLQAARLGLASPLPPAVDADPTKRDSGKRSPEDSS